MQDFNSIEQLWNSHSVEVKISSEEMLSQAKKEVNGIKTRSAYNILIMLVSVFALAGLWMLNFSNLTTHIGISILLISVIVYTIILYGDYKLISKNDFTVHPQEFLNRLRHYQINRTSLYNRIYWFYAIGLSVGTSFYFIEILGYFAPVVQWIIIGITFAWLLFCSTWVRKAVYKREKERIALLIEKFERINKQF